MIRSCCTLAAIPLLLAATAPEPPERARPLDNPGGWLTDEDYPSDAQRQELDGTTAFQLEVDRAGVPTNCTITSSSGVASLDNATCAKLLERARFVPAKDAKGRATADKYTGRITWRLPGSDGVASLPPLPMNLVTTFFIEPDGSTSDCKTLINDKPAPMEGACAQQILGRRYPVQKDAAGNPVRQKMRTILRYEKINADE